MTNNKELVNPRIIGIMLLAASILLVTTGSQNAMATGFLPGCPPNCPDLLLEEAAENATTTGGETNQTADGNMTGTNPTS